MEGAGIYFEENKKVIGKIWERQSQCCAGYRPQALARATLIWKSQGLNESVKRSNNLPVTDTSRVDTILSQQTTIHKS